MTLRFFSLFVWLLLAANSYAQLIHLTNPSFEGKPQDATMPQGWHSCKEGSTPDILPGFWGVYNEPYDGDTYVGLITREDGSFERIGQRLPEPLLAKECYTGEVFLSHSKTYAKYDIPIRLRVYAGKAICDRTQLIAQFNAIAHTDWKKYKIQFVAKEDYSYLIVEAYYAKGLSFPYRGNILIDNFSPLKKCPRAEQGKGEKASPSFF